MSRHAKLLAKLNAKPPPSDIKWDELKTVLGQLGYEMISGSGSRRKFIHREKRALIVCHQPHPFPVVDRGCIADVVEHLKTYGFI